MEGKYTEGKQHRRRGRMGQLWLTVGWEEKRAKESNEMTLLIAALEGLRLEISSPKPAWSLETAYPKESGEEEGGGTWMAMGQDKAGLPNYLRHWVKKA